MNREILVGDVFKKIKEIPDESIDCVITSPPYWSLRDYESNGQIGLEPTFHDYLDKLDRLMTELKRVIKKTGTVWVNLGDTYNNSSKGTGTDITGTKQVWTFKNKTKKKCLQCGKIFTAWSYQNFCSTACSGVDNTTRVKKGILEVKTRVGIPERFYIRCIDNGWIARNHIVWFKHASMPESVKDRFTTKWESIFFFAKKKKYYFDLDPVREPCKPDRPPKQTISPTVKNMGFYDEQASRRKASNIPSVSAHGLARGKVSGGYYPDGRPANNPLGKNPGDVFEINPKPFRDAHFATFPLELPLKILKCACPKNGVVLDPFFGAGTVGVAAEKLDRNWIGIELNKDYVKIATKRLEPYALQIKVTS